MNLNIKQWQAYLAAVNKLLPEIKAWKKGQPPIQIPVPPGSAPVNYTIPIPIQPLPPEAPATMGTITVDGIVVPVDFTGVASNQPNGTVTTTPVNTRVTNA